MINITKKVHYKYYNKQKNGSLDDLFTSELFTMDFLIDYLIHREETFIIDLSQIYYMKNSEIIVIIIYLNYSLLHLVKNIILQYSLL